MRHQDFENQIEAYFEGCLDLIEKFRFEKHVQDCLECAERIRERFLERSDGVDGLLGVFGNELSFDGCLKPETVAEYVEGRMTTEEVSLVNQHLESCVDCFAMAAEYGEYLKAGKVIWVSPQPLKKIFNLPTLATEFYGEEKVMQLAAHSVAEESLAEVQLIQDDAGAIEGRVYLDEEDDLRVTLVEYDRSLQGQKIVIAIPALQVSSDPVTLTGEPVEWNLGQVAVALSDFPEMQIRIIPKE